MNKEMNRMNIKVCIVGDTNVGKTSLLMQLTEHKFESFLGPSIGSSHSNVIVEISNYSVCLNIWDTPGAEIFRSLFPTYLRNSRSVIIVVSVDKISSMNSIEMWYDFIKDACDMEKCNIYIVVNKIDSKDYSNTDILELAKKWAAEHSFPFFATSAKQIETIKPVFIKIARDAVNPVKKVQNETNIISNFFNFFKKDEKQIQKDDQQNDLKIQLANQKKEFEIQLEKVKKDSISQLNCQKKQFDTEIADKLNLIEQLNQEKIELQKTINKLKLCQKIPINTEIKIFDDETIDNYEKIEKIGSGGGGKVYKVFRKDIYALKVMKIDTKNANNLKSFFKEYEIMNMLNHINILKTFGIFFSSKTKPPSMLLEYCPNNLETAIKNKLLTNVQIVFSIYQIAEGMKYVHFQKIIHRDLKPSNILISFDGTIKICDFGIAALMSPGEQSLTQGIGSQKYMAPEIINEETDYTEKVDVYSFGVLIYFMLNQGQLPVIKMVDLLNGKKAEIPSSFTKFATHLINSCWNFHSNDRPSFKMICDDIEKSNYNLLNLTSIELKELIVRIEQYKLKLPIVNE